MTYPKQSEIEIPLLKEIYKAGGSAKPSDIYSKIAEYFPQITNEDRERRLENYPSEFKWNNTVQWARQKLVQKGELDGSIRGTWKITEKGIKRLGHEPAPWATVEEKQTLTDLLNEADALVRDELKRRLYQFSPEEFEHFSKKLLEAVGFSDVEVTSISKDGGIDGYGKLRQGIVKINTAFQCKRWSSVVPRPELDKFRGSISGEFDQGIFITTSAFSKEVLDVSEIRTGIDFS